MGSAQSNNVAEAVANVSNFVDQSTTANTSQVNELQQQVNLTGCVLKIDGDFNVKETAQLIAQNTQIIDAKQDANLNNNIQQEMLQQATSKVGTLGIGYASASNTASEFINSTNQIINAMNVSASQFSGTSQQFNCDRSTIIAKNLDIDFSSTTDFLSTQTLKQDQTAKIVNDLSQSIKQKAEATVEGIGGFIIALILALAVMFYALAKPLDSGGVKMAVAVLLCFILASILATMYLRNTPPFFAKLNECIQGSSVGGCNSECINLTVQPIRIANPPLKYSYGLTPTDISPPGGNLLQMVIGSQLSSSAPPDNGGYRLDTLNTLQTKINIYESAAKLAGVPNIPNPLMLFDPKNLYVIPDEYLNSGGNGQPGDNSGTCTPKILQWKTGVQTTVSSCPLVIDPANQSINTATDPSLILANLNSVGWEAYLNLQSPPLLNATDTEDARALYARFVLLDLIGNVDLHLYVKPTELVKYLDENNNVIIDLAKNRTDKCYMYSPVNITSWRDGLPPGTTGTIQGLVGTCNDSEYKFHKFMKKIGVWIILSFIILTFLYMGYTTWKNKGKKPVQKAGQPQKVENHHKMLIGIGCLGGLYVVYILYKKYAEKN